MTQSDCNMDICKLGLSQAPPPSPPVLGRSFNPISTRGGHIIPTKYYEPPEFLDLATALQTFAKKKIFYAATTKSALLANKVQIVIFEEFHCQSAFRRKFRQEKLKDIKEGPMYLRPLFHVLIDIFHLLPVGILSEKQMVLIKSSRFREYP